MPWIKFTSASQTNEFIDAIYELYTPLIDRLWVKHHPFFFDYWLKRLNYSNSYLLKSQSNNIAFVSLEQGTDIHWQRWRYNTLVTTFDLEDNIQLPDDISSSQIFTVPTENLFKLEKHLEHEQISTLQESFIIQVDDHSDLLSHPDYKVHLMESIEVEKVLQLLESENWSELPEDYIPTLKEEIIRIGQKRDGWCFIATHRESNQIVGLASYLGYTLPLLGTSCAFIGDLLVIPAQRGQGIASALQKSAYQILKSFGIYWVMGNIIPENQASLRQAIKAKRECWLKIIDIS